ncbi:MAG: Hsp20/alpha crystallin family protein [Candidatus Eisenbacteria bacterium]
MTLVRWNPMRDMLTLENEMGRLLQDLSGRAPEGETPALWSPRVDIEEGRESYVVKAELPGIKLEDIKITIADNQLVVRGERRREVEKNDTTYHRVERVYGAFERAFTLTKAVAADKIEALYRDGVLEIRVPKAEEAKAREIQIKIEK